MKYLQKYLKTTDINPRHSSRDLHYYILLKTLQLNITKGKKYGGVERTSDTLRNIVE